MKIKRLAVLGTAEDELREEFKNAQKVSEVRLGEKHLFYRYFIRVSAIAYEQIQKIFLRVESGEVGEFPLTEHYLMVYDLQGNEYKFRLERPEDAKRVISYFEENRPQIEVGYFKQKEKRKQE